jgi:histone acetyltransferase (RNA polymerase elongator complex component)
MSHDTTIQSIARQLERAPERVETARKALEGWRGDLEKMVKKSPVRTVLGAMVVGWLVAKVGRYI